MTIYLIVLMGIVGQIGYNGSRIAVSLYALGIGTSQFTLGVLIALYAVFPMLLAVFVGKFVDRAGPLLPVILGIFITGAALVLPPLFPGIAALYVACAALGLAHLFFMIPLEVSAGGASGPQRRSANFALLSMGWSIANFFGPIVAGFSIDHIGPLRVFWVLALFSVLPVLVLWIRPGLLARTTTRSAEDGHGSALELWRLPNMRTIYIAAAVVSSALYLFQFYFPIYGHALGISASAIGTILGAVGIAAFVIRSVIPFLLRIWTEAQILTRSIFVTALAFLLLPFVSNPYVLASIAFAFGLGVGCANPLSMSLLYALTPPGRVAESVGLLRAGYNVTQLVVPIMFGSVGAAFGFSTVFLSSAAMLVAGGFRMRRIRLPAADPRAN